RARHPRARAPKSLQARHAAHRQGLAPHGRPRLPLPTRLGSRLSSPSVDAVSSSASIVAPPVSTRLGVGYAAALGSAAFFAVGGVIAKSAFDLGVQPRVLAEWRVLFAFVAFTVIVGVWRPRYLRVRREDLVWFAAFGVFGMG